MFDLNRYQNNIAVITDSKDVFTYSDLHNMQAELFQHIGGRKLIAVLCENKIGALLGYICFINNQIVPMMLDKNLNTELLKNLFDEYHPDYLWIPEENDYFNEYKVKCVLCGYKLIEYNNLNDIILFDQLALLLTTSGSTGSPKFVRISYDNLKSNTNSIISYLNITESEKAITVLPMSYTYGLSVINTHLYIGACIMLTDKKIFDKEFWLFFNEFKGTSFSGVPYTYDLLRKMNFKALKVPSLRTMTQAGGKMSNDTSTYFYNYAINTNKTFYIMYGQTEATARISYLPFEYMHRKKGSIGVPVKGGSIELVDENNDKIREASIVGEIIYKGKNVSLGYAINRSDLEKGDENQGILHTGDLAYYDSDNFIFICGRKNRYVKFLGNRINLDDLETLLNRKYFIETICLYKNGRFHIITNAIIAGDSMKKYISEVTGINKKYFVTDMISNIPRLSSGKIDYNIIEKFINEENMDL